MIASQLKRYTHNLNYILAQGAGLNKAGRSPRVYVGFLQQAWRPHNTVQIKRRDVVGADGRPQGPTLHILSPLYLSPRQGSPTIRRIGYDFPSISKSEHKALSNAK